MRESYETLVKCYHYKGNEFAIIKGLHDGIIRAINFKYLDENGLLKEPLNGLQMFCNHHNNTVDKIIERINSYIDWQEYINKNNINTDDPEQLQKAIKEFYKL